MPSERVQRRIDTLLGQADEAAGARDWQKAAELAQAALDLDPDNADAKAFLAGAQRALQRAAAGAPASAVKPVVGASRPPPTSFANGDDLPGDACSRSFRGEQLGVAYVSDQASPFRTTWALMN